MRISKKELDKSINSTGSKKINISSPETSFTNADLGSKSFDKTGKQIPNSSNKDDIFASTFVSQTITKYWVKCNNDGELFKVDDKIYLSQSVAKAHRDGMPPFKMMECDQGTYKGYLKYLQTRNTQYLPASLR